jgi:hypothetical protein
VGCGPTGGPPVFAPWGYAPPVYQQPAPPPARTVTLPRPVVDPPAVRPVAVPPPDVLGVKLDAPAVTIPPPADLGIELGR